MAKKIPIDLVKKIPFKTLSRLLDKMRDILKKDPVKRRPIDHRPRQDHQSRLGLANFVGDPAPLTETQGVKSPRS